MHKKAIIVIAIIVGLLIITSGVVGAVLVLNKKTSPTTSDQTPATVNGGPEEQEAQTTPDLSVDLGACTVVTHTDVSESLAPTITSVRDAVNRGFGYERNGDKSQSCVYPFSADDNLSNRLTVTVTEFSSATNKSDAEQAIEDFSEVTGIGEKASFMSALGTTDFKQNTYSLFVIKDMKMYLFAIAQPTDSDKFTAASAQSALETLAKSL
jgi:hypothetical protein